MKTKINIPRLYLLLAIGIFFISAILIVLDILSYGPAVLVDTFLNRYGVNFLLNIGLFNPLFVLFGLVFLVVSLKRGGSRKGRRLVVIGIALYFLSWLIGASVIVPA